MISSATIKKSALTVAALAASAVPAYAHVEIGATSSFAAGLGHPFAGLDHMTAMIAVGLWAAIKGGKAIYAWPLTFVVIMVGGFALGILGVPIPFVEPGILASVVVLGILVALAIDLPIAAGMAIIGLFALLHGHAHGTEVPESMAGLEYVAGFVLATAVLHAIGIAAALALGSRLRGLVRAAGAASVAIAAGLAFGVI